MARRELAGKVALVTGATSGIGFETAAGLARLHARVLVHGRTAATAAAAVARLRALLPEADLEAVSGDLSTLEAIRTLAIDVTAVAPVLDILVNNAGTIQTVRQATADGIEQQWAVNHVAPFLLTQRLLDQLMAGREPGRVINISSRLHYRGAPDLADPQWAQRRYKGVQAYADSKFALTALTNLWARRISPEKVLFFSLHPGAVATSLGSGAGWVGLLLKLVQPFLISAEEGARTPLHLASAPDIAPLSGCYFEHSNMRSPHPRCLDGRLQDDLWEHTARLCGLTG